MYLYDIIYNFYYTYIFGSDLSNFLYWSFPMQQVLDGEVLTYPLDGISWLCDTFTIITLTLIVIVLIRLIIWLFKLFGNLLGGGK